MSNIFWEWNKSKKEEFNHNRETFAHFWNFGEILGGESVWVSNRKCFFLPLSGN